MNLKPIASCLVLFTTLTACTRALPAPEVPHDALQTSPDMPPAKADEGHIIVDVLGANARVNEVTADVRIGRHAKVEQTHVVCVSTPCGAAVPRGDHLLQISGEGLDSADVGVRVTDKPSIVRVLPAQRTPSGVARIIGILSIPVGGAAAIAGACAFGVGAGTNDKLDRREAFEQLGTAMMISGVVVLVTGIILTVIDRPSLRPAAFAQWNL
jgi:hypothetical protein